jgi:cysteinyl-tRNA synthetase
MDLRLYDTLTREKRPFVPLDANNVRMYVCGPTVYDFAHIGNARPVIVFDVLFRLLRHLYGESHVTYVRNITDVDDKINARAAQDFPGLPLNEAIRRVTEETAAQFHTDAAALGALPPTFEPRATDFVLPRSDGKADMVTLIKQLIARGHAYEAGGEVLFDTASMPDYGMLSGRKLDEQKAGARVAVEAHKKNPADFVLWKQSSVDEPGWESPWGRGRPGWHIECSAMSEAYLGEVFDIHGGGLDLIFPHHENELAQSRCAHGTSVMANYWMHNGFLEVEGKKMSKSEGNFVTIRDLLETDSFGGRPWHGAVLRFAMLQSHYRQPIDWTIEKLKNSRVELFSFSAAAGNPIVAAQLIAETAAGVVHPVDEEVVSALGDDLNTPLVITRLRAIAKEARTSPDSAKRLLTALKFLGIMDEKSIHYFDLTGPITDLSVGHIVHQNDDGTTIERLRTAQANGQLARVQQLKDLIEGWGVRLRLLQGNTWSIEKSGNENLFELQVKDLIAARAKARARKDFKESDRIRDELAAMGVTLRDFKDPATGEMKTEIAR